MRIALREVLETATLHGLSVGAPIDQIEMKLGAPPLPRCRLGKRSRIWSYRYGNVSVLASERVLSFMIDFPERDGALVTAADVGSWRIEDWSSYAVAEGFVVSRTSDGWLLDRADVTVGLAPEDALHVVHIRGRRAARSEARSG
jgi:hypothetical protein